MIVREEFYDLSAPTIKSQIVSLKASGADAFFQATTPKFTAQAIRKAHEIGWKPLHVILATSSQPSTTLKSAGFEASTGIVTSIWRKLPGNPEWTDDPAMKDYFSFVKQWASGKYRGSDRPARLYLGADAGGSDRALRRRSVARKPAEAGNHDIGPSDADVSSGHQDQHQFCDPDAMASGAVVFFNGRD